MDTTHNLGPIGRLGEDEWEYLVDRPGQWFSFYSGAYSVLDGSRVDDITLTSIKRVDAAYGESPEGGGSREIAILVELRDGQWATCLAWADYTGWGCQYGIQWKVAPDRDQAIMMGLDREARSKLDLNYPADTA